MTRAIFGKVMWVGRVRALALGAAVATALALCLLALQPAEAAFPGNNGKIAFVSNRDVGGAEIYTIGPNGGAATRITFPTGGNSDPAFSPNGTKIAFRSGSRTNYEISVMNANGSGRVQLTNTPSAEQEPAWSPDGSKIVFAANSFDVDGETDLEIWTINADGTERTQITNNTFPDTSPAWSPDGSRIAFVSARTGDTDRNVYVMNADGTGQAASITPNSPTGCSSNCYQGQDENPTWSPDGSRIAYVHGYGPEDNPFAGGGVPNIWTMDPNGADKTNVSNNPETSAVQPAWSPNGNRIAYVGTASGTTNRDIWTMNADGTAPGVLQANVANDINPDWQPDSIPPKVTGVSPTGRRVAPQANATATFSEAMNRATLNRTTFKLVKKGTRTAIRATVSYSGNRAVLNPSRGLARGATYTAIVTTGAKDVAGNPLATSRVWAFKVKR